MDSQQDSSLFNFNCFSVSLNPKFKCLSITFKAKKRYLDLELLFELDSILAWAASRIEVATIYISSENECLGLGIDKTKLKSMNSEKVETLLKRTQKIIWGMMHLPQTIIMDLGVGASDLSAELALGADIRLAQIDALMHFNHIQLGLLPSSGSLSLLSHLVGHAYSRKWIYKAQGIHTKELLNSGLISDTYHDSNDQEVTKKLYLQSLIDASPTQRIQAKVSFLSILEKEMKNSSDREEKSLKASLLTQDWQAQSSDDFTKVHDLKKALHLGLIRGGLSEED